MVGGGGRSGQGEQNEEARRSVGVNAWGEVEVRRMREGGGAGAGGRQVEPLTNNLQKTEPNRLLSSFRFSHRENRILQPNGDNSGFGTVFIQQPLIEYYRLYQRNLRWKFDFVRRGSCDSCGEAEACF